MAGGSPVDHFELIGSTLAGRYVVESRVAEGGFAVVYRAYQASLDRYVALKVLKTPADMTATSRASFRERFAAEARTIAKLKHPYLVTVHDFGVDAMPSGEAAPWMALEWLDGETLEADLERRRGAGGRSPAETIRLLRPIVDALAYAHRQGIVHRDVKPANMMLVPAEEGRVLRMMDFGVSKMMRRGPHDTTALVGTSGWPGFSPEYAAPEQVNYSRTGPWTDVHALGLVMTELLTDAPPYAAADDVHLFEQAMAPSRPTPRARGRQVGSLEKVIEKAVALSPRKRWPDAGALLAAIDGLSLTGAAEKRTFEAASRSTDAGAPAPGPAPSVRWPDRIVTAVGGAVIVVALALVSWTLRSDRPGSSFSEEVAATAARAPRRPPHPGPGPAVSPWVIPLPTAPPTVVSPAPVAAAVSERHLVRTGSEPGRGQATFSGRVPRDGPDPGRLRDAGPRARWVDPFADGEGGSRACRLTVNSTPWSEVWLDGRSTSQHTPLVDYPVSCGTHQLEFKRADLRIDQIETVVTDAGQPFKRRYMLGGD
jgi:serine/threonine protein kinase